MKKITIAIDGFSSCGKSTFAKRIAAELGYLFIDSGAMYRGVTLYAMEHGMITDGKIDKPAIINSLCEIDVSFVFNAQRGKSELFLNGKCVEERIRSMEVSGYVSMVSAVDEVREFLVQKQQDMGRAKGIVMDGRDIGTVVFPDAELKVFMTADPEIRAQRRYDELKNTDNRMSIDDIRKNLSSRDYADQNRSISPLRKADDALVLDNSTMSVDEQMEWVNEKINKLVK